MLASPELQGTDLFQRVLDAAAARARIVLGERIALVRCDHIEIRHGHADPHFEAWCVRDGNGDATISAIASCRDEVGRERVVVAGRFTFSVVATGQS
ncbi:MAG: hypothetical protein P0Y64_08250 [Candidatus Sphingomonas colombiensis]|nr:hypothetical protein [Sphingomonas sp.]WEK44750.1 MAG: hypothetical protein P0Y64_08250 [Sphingomonas sp.]